MGRKGCTDRSQSRAWATARRRLVQRTHSRCGRGLSDAIGREVGLLCCWRFVNALDVYLQLAAMSFLGANGLEGRHGNTTACANVRRPGGRGSTRQKPNAMTVHGPATQDAARAVGRDEARSRGRAETPGEQPVGLHALRHNGGAFEWLRVEGKVVRRESAPPLPAGLHPGGPKTLPNFTGFHFSTPASRARPQSIRPSGHGVWPWRSGGRRPHGSGLFPRARR